MRLDSTIIGIRKDKKRRHEFSVHGFRKYFKTKAEQSGMKPINVEILMGHSVGISDSYYRPTEAEIVQDYLKARRIDYFPRETASP
jgi:integrase